MKFMSGILKSIVLYFHVINITLVNFRPTAPQITVITLPKSGSCYNMNHRNQGKVIVFNHKEVDGEEIREGTQQDVERITKTFSNLGFEVIVHNDLILEEIKKVLEKCMFK